jgi:hypothetical protein
VAELEESARVWAEGGSSLERERERERGRALALALALPLVRCGELGSRVVELVGSAAESVVLPGDGAV